MIRTLFKESGLFLYPYWFDPNHNNNGEVIGFTLSLVGSWGMSDAELIGRIQQITSDPNYPQYHNFYVNPMGSNGKQEIMMMWAKDDDAFYKYISKQIYGKICGVVVHEVPMSLEPEEYRKRSLEVKHRELKRYLDIYELDVLEWGYRIESLF